MKKIVMHRAVHGLLFLLMGFTGLTAAAQPSREALQDSIRCQTVRIAYRLALQKATTKKKRLCAPKINHPGNFAALKKFVDTQSLCNDADISDLRSLVAYAGAWEMPSAGPATAEAIIPASVMALPVFNQKVYKNKRTVIETQLRGYLAAKVAAGDWDGLRHEDGLFGGIRYSIQQSGIPGGAETVIFAVLLLLGGGGVYFLLRKPKKKQVEAPKQPKPAPLAAKPEQARIAPEDRPTPPTVEQEIAVPEITPKEEDIQTPDIQPVSDQTWVDRPLPSAAQETPPVPEIPVVPVPRTTPPPAPKRPPVESILEPPKLYNPHSPELREQPKTPASGLKMPWENDTSVTQPQESATTGEPPVETSEKAATITPPQEQTQPAPLPPAPEQFPEPVARLYFGFPDENGVLDVQLARQRYANGRTYLELCILPGEKTAYFTLCEEIDTAMARNLVLQWASIAPVCYAERLTDTVLRFETLRPGLADCVNQTWVCTRKASIRCVEAS